MRTLERLQLALRGEKVKIEVGAELNEIDVILRTARGVKEVLVSVIQDMTGKKSSALARLRQLDVHFKPRWPRHSRDKKLGVELLDQAVSGLGLAPEELDRLKWLIGNHMRAHNFLELRPGNKEQILRSPNLPSLMRLQEADARATIDPDGRHSTVHREVMQQAFEELKLSDARKAKDTEFKSIVNGADVRNAGFTVKEIGQILHKLREAWDKGEFINREQALKLLEELKGARG